MALKKRSRNIKPRCLDCEPREFSRVMAAIPRGMVFKSSERIGCWRDFTFSYTGERNHELERNGFKRGQLWSTAVVCKL